MYNSKFPRLVRNCVISEKGGEGEVVAPPLWGGWLAALCGLRQRRARSTVPPVCHPKESASRICSLVLLSKASGTCTTPKFIMFYRLLHPP